MPTPGVRVLAPPCSATAADYLIAVLSHRGHDDYPGDTIAELSRLAHDYYNPAESPPS
ncbi:MAG: hypothetical protein WBF66_02865 [Dehalococcoidia bacterium]